jgi:transcriptional regulator with XRE-family HTH domain
MTVTGTENEFARLLGATLRNQRVARGLSLRSLARQIGLSGHGTLIDYEYGRRIPPEDLLVACEKVLQVSGGQLRNLREKALAERADHATSVLLNAPAPAALPLLPAPPPLLAAPPVPAALPLPGPPGPPRGVGAGPLTPQRRPKKAGARWRSRRSILAAAIVLLVAAATGVIVTGMSDWGAPRKAGPLAGAGFESEVGNWVVLYGAQVGNAQVTTSLAYAGQSALLVTIGGASATKGYVAVGTTQGLHTLRPGMRVTLHLWVPGLEDGGVRFFVYSSTSQTVWAPETAETEVHLPTRTGWSALSWTVPPVDHVHAIGMQIWSEYDRPLVMALDAIRW